MTRERWLACLRPGQMLPFLLGTIYPRVQDVDAFPNSRGSDRKLRLFACACYYRISYLLPVPIAQEAVAVAERFADGVATLEELQQTESRVRETLEALEGPWRASQGAERTALLPMHEALALALQVVWLSAPKAAHYAASNASLAVAAISHPAVGTSDPGFCASRATEESVQAGLLRCIFGNLFHPAEFDPAWFSSNDGLAVKTARTIYEKKWFEHLPLLAEVLEDAGCQDADILGHCRHPGPHARGCWVVDSLVGKK